VNKMPNLLRLGGPLRRGIVRPRQAQTCFKRSQLCPLFHYHLNGAIGFPSQSRVSSSLLSTHASSTDDHDNDASTTSSPSSPGTMDRDTKRDYRYKISVLCKKKTYQSAQAAQDILQKLVDEGMRTQKMIAGYGLHNTCLGAWANCGHPDGFKKAAELLDLMERHHQENPFVAPAATTGSYNIVLTACARSAALKQTGTDAIAKAEELVRRMESINLHSPSGDVDPDTHSYNLVILAHANTATQRYGAAAAAEDWLRYLSKIHTEGGPGPDNVSFNTVMKAWRSSPENKGADRALELLNLMLKLYRDHEQVAPCQYSFSIVIDAFAKRNRPKEAEDVLKMSLAFFIDPEHAAVGPEQDTVFTHFVADLRPCFNAAINGWAKSGDNNAPERADALLFDMHSIGKETQAFLAEPDVLTYASCMEAYARSGRPDAPEIVESRLYAMLEQHRNQNGRAPLPNRTVFDIAIRTWHKSNKKFRAERMEELLRTMLHVAERRNDRNLLPKPDTVNLCIAAWCKVGQAKTRAFAIVDRMEVLGCVDSGSYLPLFIALLEDGKNKKDKDSIYAAAAILEKYQSQIKIRHNINWPTDPEALYNRLFFAFVAIGDGNAADRAYSILEGMERNMIKAALPSCVSYSAVIAALAKDPSPSRAQKALELFDHALNCHYDPASKVTLDSYIFHAMLSYFANTKQRWAADRAHSFLQMLHEMYLEDTSNKLLRPHFRCYDKCLQAMARCGDPDSVRKAVAMLNEFVDNFYLGKGFDVPSEVGINTVYKYCSWEGTSEALKLAEEVVLLKENLRRDGRLHERPRQND
jgi:pentatricopeptide repeat protein